MVRINNSIQKLNFNVTSPETRENTVLVEEIQECNILMSPAGFIQILKGAEVIVYDENKNNHPDNVDEWREWFSLYTSIHSHLYESLGEATRNNSVVAYLFTRKEIKVIRYWLQCRIAHCEDEAREEVTGSNGEPKFRLETYILQRQLLNELDTLLLGRIIE